MFIPAILGIYWWYKTYRDSVSLTYLQSQFIIGFAPVSLSVTFLQLISLIYWLGFVVAFIEGSNSGEGAPQLLLTLPQRLLGANSQRESIGR